MCVCACGIIVKLERFRVSPSSIRLLQENNIYNNVKSIRLLQENDFSQCLVASQLLAVQNIFSVRQFLFDL